MTNETPFETVAAFVDAVNRGDVESAIEHYAADAAFVAEPGAVVSGLPAIRAALAAMLAARPRIVTRSHAIVATADLALYHSDWEMAGAAPDGTAFVQSGKSADVLRRGEDCRWRIVIDNPWGTLVLGADG